MPRKPRKTLGSLIVHNISQGINKEFIFEQPNNKNKYLELMKKYSKKYNITVIAYCIMGNHCHLLLYSKSLDNISKFMKEVNAIYAMYYNKKNKRVGYVFKYRFKSVPVYSEKQLFQCIKYIHMNPVKARIVAKENEYRFSSYNDYIMKTGFVNSKVLNLIFGEEKNCLEKLLLVQYNNLDVDNQEVSLDNALKESMRIEGINKDSIKKCSVLIKKFLSYLISNEYKFTKVQISIILGISRANLYRKLGE